MKNYREFMDYVKEHVTDYLPEKYENMEIRIEQVVKNNDVVWDGLLIINPETQVSPNIYLNLFYEEYKEGKDLDTLVSRVADLYVENIEPEINTGTLTEELSQYEKIKDNIYPRVSNLERNRKRLENIPYTAKEDLAVTYHIKVAENQEGIASVVITKPMLEQYGITTEELHNLAMGNMEHFAPTKFMPLREVMVELMAGDFANSEGISLEEARDYVRETLPMRGPELYCLTNEKKVNGAAYILNEDVQKMVAERVGGDYYVLPSSVHEVLILPKEEEVSGGQLRDMVQSVNQNCLSPEEFLSDQVYEYDARTHNLSICTFTQDRKQEQNMIRTLRPAMVTEESNLYDQKQPEQNHEPMKHGVKGH
jgi:hypothetical protein